MDTISTYNRHAWNREAKEQRPWSVPVDSATIERAKQGCWQVHLTPTPLPAHWLGDVKGKKILCLASAGGQQAPVLAAAGADVTVFDLSEEQLEQDRRVALRDHLTLTTQQGDMRDLSQYADNHFDIVFHPISNLYVPDVNPVWREAHRVLKPQGVLMASFYNSVIFIGDRDPIYAEQGVIRPVHKMPYAEIETVSPEEKQRKIEAQEAFVFGHSLTDLIGGQTQAGFAIVDFYEDWQPNPRFVVDHYLPTFIATKAIKR